MGSKTKTYNGISVANVIDDDEYGEAKLDIEAALRPQIRNGMGAYAKARWQTRKEYRTRFSSKTLKEKGVSVDATGSLSLLNTDAVLAAIQQYVSADEVLSVRMGNPTSLEILLDYYLDVNNILYNGDMYLLKGHSVSYETKLEPAGTFPVLEPYYDESAELDKWRIVDTSLDTSALYSIVSYTLEKQVTDTINNWFDTNGYNRVGSSVFIIEDTVEYEYTINYNAERVGDNFITEISRIDDELNIITLIFNIDVETVDLEYDPDIRVSHGKVEGYKYVSYVNPNAMETGSVLDYPLVIPTSLLPTPTGFGIYNLNEVISGDIFTNPDYQIVSVQYTAPGSTDKLLYVLKYYNLEDMEEIASSTAVELSPIIPLKLNFETDYEPVDLTETQAFLEYELDVLEGLGVDRVKAANSHNVVYTMVEYGEIATILYDAAEADTLTDGMRDRLLKKLKNNTIKFNEDKADILNAMGTDPNSLLSSLEGEADVKNAYVWYGINPFLHDEESGDYNGGVVSDPKGTIAKLMWNMFFMAALAPGEVKDVNIKVPRLELQYPFSLEYDVLQSKPVGASDNTYWMTSEEYTTQEYDEEGWLVTITRYRFIITRSNGDGTYSRMQITDLTMKQIVDGYMENTGPDVGKINHFRLLIPQELLNKMAFNEWLYIHERSLGLFVHSQKTVKIKWYRTGLFGFILFVIILVYCTACLSSSSGFFIKLATGIALSYSLSLMFPNMTPWLRTLIVMALMGADTGGGTSGTANAATETSVTQTISPTTYLNSNAAVDAGINSTYAGGMNLMEVMSTGSFEMMTDWATQQLTSMSTTDMVNMVSDIGFKIDMQITESEARDIAKESEEFQDRLKKQSDYIEPYLDEVAETNRSLSSIIEWIKIGGKKDFQQLNPLLAEVDPQSFHQLMNGQLLFEPSIYTGITAATADLSNPSAIPMYGTEAWKETQKRFHN